METAAGFAKFLALNAATLLAAFTLASRLPFTARSQRLLGAGVIAVAISNATGLLLGLSGSLRYGPLLASQVALAALGCFSARWRVMLEFLDPRCVVRIVETRLQWAALGLLAIAYAYAMFLGFVSETFAGDELMYHLPLVAEYARAGAITVPQLGRYWCNEFWAYYPGAAYLLYQWLVLPFGTGLIVDLAQWPYAFGTALATYVLARIVGARRGDAVWAAILLLAVPIVMNQSKTALVDLVLSFLYAAGLAFLLLEPLTVAGVALAAFAWGAAPAIKLPAMMYIALGAVCVALVQYDRHKGRALRVLLPIGAAVGASLVLFSGYWFLRNYLLMGSALYPLNLRPEPRTAWSNVIFYGLLFPLLDFSPATPEVFNYETGAGPQFVCLGVPALLAYGAASWRERRLGGVALAVLPFAAYVVWLVRLSTSVQTLLRYVVPAMPVAFAAFAWVLPRVRQRRLMLALAFGCVVFAFIVGVPRLGTYTDEGSLRYGLGKWRRGEATTRFDIMGSVDLQDYRRAWSYFDQLPGRHDIAATHLIFSYPMLGADFRHHLHFLEETDPQRWWTQLRARNIDHVAVSESVDETGQLLIQDAVVMQLKFMPAGDESLHASRHLEPRRVQALRLRYTSTGPENARVVVGVNRYASTWELPLARGESRVEVMPWDGDLSSVDFALDFIPRTSLRAEIGFTIESLEVQDGNGEWIALPNAERGAWEVLRWPMVFYWLEAHPERFKLALRDVDFWRSRLSGELRVYEIRPEREDDGAAS